MRKGKDPDPYLLTIGSGWLKNMRIRIRGGGVCYLFREFPRPPPAPSWQTGGRTRPSPTPAISPPSPPPLTEGVSSKPDAFLGKIVSAALYLCINWFRDVYIRTKRAVKAAWTATNLAHSPRKPGSASLYCGSRSLFSLCCGSGSCSSSQRFESAISGLQTLQGSILSLHASIMSAHGTLTDPPRLHFEPPRIHHERPRHSIALFWASKPLEFWLTVNADTDLSFFSL